MSSLPLPPAHIAVVGTGVVGLAAALGCARQGHAVTLIGPEPKAPPADARERFDERIYAISPGAQRLLEELRIWGRLDAARSCAVRRMQVWGDDGGQLQFDARRAGVERLATICEEDRLLEALWLGVSLTPGVDALAQEFAGAQFEAGRVRLHLRDGSPAVCDLLLGADGRASAVRAAAGIGAQSTPYGHTAIVANFRCERAHQDIARQWFTGTEGVVALLPLPGRHVSLVWSAPPVLAAELEALAPGDFAERVARRSGGALGALEAIGGRRAFTLQRLVVERLVRPGVALLGDAAHVVHPLAGQGLNLGLQDLSEFLRQLQAREPWRALGDPVWLRRYERARAEPVALMRHAVGGLARLFAAPGSGVRRLRNAGMSAVDALAPLKQALVRHAMG